MRSIYIARGLQDCCDYADEPCFLYSHQGIEQEVRNIPPSSTNPGGGVLQQAPRAAKGKRDHASEMMVL